VTSTRFGVAALAASWCALVGLAAPPEPVLPAAMAPAPSVASRDLVGQVAPEFTLLTYSRKSITLSSMRGQVVVLNYWATWCVPCRTEIPMLDTYFRRHGNRGLRIFAITTEDSVPAYQLRDLSRELAFPLVLKMRGRHYLPTDGLPTNFVIDREGVLRYAKAGAFTYAEFDALIRPMLDEPA
jgi:cytochrome c biogenesis protein CcmG, thiol:disulfide interchange protein DsbE